MTWRTPWGAAVTVLVVVSLTRDMTGWDAWETALQIALLAVIWYLIGSSEGLLKRRAKWNRLMNKKGEK